MARTPNLSDLQLILLSTAAARDDGNLLPLAKSIAATPAARLMKEMAALLKRALVAEIDPVERQAIWREDGERRIGLVITDAARGLIDGKPSAATQEVPSPVAEAPASQQRSTKAAEVLALLRRDQGATLAELIAATSWLPHTTRAALTGLRKKGHAIERSKRGDETCYRVAAA